jgi:hypothetical protein
MPLGVGVGGEMASEAKDVGILAMDIYFPPNCVLQVPSPDSHSPFGPSLG